jgi:hypothetical protein
MVDLRQEGPDGLVTVPFELLEIGVEVGDQLEALDMDGELVAKATVAKIAKKKAYDRTLLVTLRVPKGKAIEVAGFKVQDRELSEPARVPPPSYIDDQTIICRCERVKAGEIRKLIGQGIKDMNQFTLIMRLYQQEGVDLCDVVPFTQRPLIAEVNLGMLAGEEPDAKE